MGMGMGMGLPMRFEEQYHCYSMAYAEKAHLEVSQRIRVFEYSKQASNSILNFNISIFQYFKITTNNNILS